MFKDKFNKLIEERQTNVFRISKESGIPSTTMQEWRHGRTEPGIQNLKKIADYFQVPVNYFIE